VVSTALPHYWPWGPLLGVHSQRVRTRVQAASAVPGTLLTAAARCCVSAPRYEENIEHIYGGVVGPTPTKTA
jgi:hypothetical protein